jgi:hypothetical protein
MNKQEAMDRIAAIEAEAAKLRAIIKAPESVPPQVGRICFVSDVHEKCSHDCNIDLVREMDGTWFFGQQCRWRYARIATWDELGVPWVAEAEKLLEELSMASWHHQQEAKRILAMRDGRTE